MASWTLETISWDRFDASKVDPEILRNIKAAALVERNGGDYGIYLGRVFADDPAFIAAVDTWASEEVQHGMALGRWAQLADPSWDFDAAFARFRAGYKLPLDAAASVRGSQAGEMMARCIVETGTSSYYSALKDATDEPVLKQICGQHRGRRVPPLQAVLRASAALPGARSAEPLGPPAHRLGPHGRERGRRARLCLLRGQRARGRGLRPQAQHGGLCPAGLSALPPASTCSAPWRWC